MPAASPVELAPAPASSLSEAHRSVSAAAGRGWLARLAAFSGPGYMIAVGYMDPGNWATDIAGGSNFGYALLSVILASSLMAVLLQALAVRLGIATGLDLAQMCRAHFPRWLNLALWIACELAIIACDVAEVIGTAIALKLLFGLPLLWGAVLTALDTFLLLALLRLGFRWLEALVAVLIALIAACFAVEIALAAPPAAAVLGGFAPTMDIIRDPAMLYVAIGIVGATVMPHNLYLHSSLVQTRDFARDAEGRDGALAWATLDSTLALTFALFVNAAILIVAAAAFHAPGRAPVEEIEQAYELLSPALGAGIASILFAVALLASGVNSTLTATLAGQIVMEGFLRLRFAPWLRRLVTRALAIAPVIAATAMVGDQGASRLLVLSQVVLSMQLPFAMIPLVWFVSNARLMGRFAIATPWKIAAWFTAGVIVALNLKLLADAALGG